MKLSLKIATRFLKSSLGQTFLIVLGIAIGVSVQIFIGSLIQGLQKSLIEKTIGNSSQITLVSKGDDKKIKDYVGLKKKIAKVDGNIETIAVVNDQAAFMEYEDNSQSILMRGFQAKEANEIYGFMDGMVEGTYPKKEKEIILGMDLKEEYDLSLNQKVTITTTNQKVEECIVVGFFDLKVASINQSWAITTLETTQNLFETGNTVTGIEMQVKEDASFSVDEIAKKMKDDLDDENLKVDHWMEQNQQLLSGLQGQSISSYMIQFFVLISVVLGIASVLAITVMQKSRQIGILKAMGIKKTVAGYVFLWEGLILGLSGALEGIIFGLGLAFAFTKFALNPDGTPVVALYISYPFIFISGVIAVVSSVLAASIPAIRSSKLNPIDIIRNN